jgi:hypothetical protein
MHDLAVGGTDQYGLPPVTVAALAGGHLRGRRGRMGQS